MSYWLIIRLWTYLADLNEQAQERLFLIVEQMKAAEGVTEELKAADQMAWIRAMNSIHNRAEEKMCIRDSVCHIFYGRALRRAAHGKTILSKKRL